jgi:dTDP-4-amino-4,6-dideoxygalactose transaminase
MSVPFVDLKSQADELRDELLAAVERVVCGANYILGDDVAEFEQSFAEFCGTEFAIGVANGTEAIHLALRAVGCAPGDEVVTAANSFIASALAIHYAGATPVLVDVNPTYYTLDVDALERAITPRTKAIVPVHLYGQPADMGPILELADKHGLKVVQDACQSHGALHGATPVASLGDAACFSFYPSKNLGGCGDGGAIVTNDAQLAQKLRMMRNYGQRAKNDYAMIGYNCRLDTLQAAILSAKLPHLPRWNEQRRAIARTYCEALADANVVLPAERPGTTHVYHLFVVRHPERDAMLAHLQDAGIQCGVHYPTPIHQCGPFRAARTVPDGAPTATRLAGEILSLPMYPELDEESVLRVAESVQAFSLVSR